METLWDIRQSQPSRQAIFLANKFCNGDNMNFIWLLANLYIIKFYI